MNTKHFILGAGALVAALLGLFVLADDGWERSSGRPDVEPVDNAEYASECSACHFAYQPGLLPARSWEALMAGLQDHFGENAELDTAANGRITRYLTEHAADVATARLPKYVVRDVAATDVPLRISRLPEVAEEHDEIPARLYRDNPEVGSLSNCAACHREAAAGFYDEHTVVVPRYGAWDD